MPRIRTIKPDFFTSLTIADLTKEARLTFIGLWTHVDDEGRCVDDARLVKAAVWPLDDRTAKDVDVDLWEISDAGLVLRYAVDGKKFIAVSGWQEHQRINRPTPSKFPAPEKGEQTPKGLNECSVRTHGGLSEDSREPHKETGEGSFTPHVTPEMSEFGVGVPEDAQPYPGAVVLPMFTSENTTSEGTHGELSESSLKAHDRKGKEQGTGKGKETTSPRSARMSGDALESEFQEWYGGYPLKKEPGAAKTAYKKARKKATAQELLDGRDRYIAFDRNVARGFVKYPATWLNKECWLDEYGNQLQRASGDGYQPYQNPTNQDVYDEDLL
ncbi:hypothetical protein ABZ635_25995 [Nocardiopsis sp. NPDC007018]|uniref:hypothetical protein n=1 Tax=Nocardiopsis sp. NPDC007018 TaxID=3155721 RepID=UPI00340AA8EF